jgi:hypothetical protein
MAELPPLPPRKADQRQQSTASSASPSNPPAKRAIPDPRPMRLVYGSGAVAIVSVIAVGLVQPDYNASADQASTTDSNGAAAAQTIAQKGTTESASRRQHADTGNAQPDTQVVHVTRYIHLKPGQVPPPGATVIQPGQPTPRVVVSQPGPAVQPPAAHNANPPAANPPPVVHNPPPVVHNPPPPPPPAKPPVKSRQSGHP